MKPDERALADARREIERLKKEYGFTESKTAAAIFLAGVQYSEDHSGVISRHERNEEDPLPWEEVADTIVSGVKRTYNLKDLERELLGKS